MMAYAFITAWLLPLAGFVLLLARGRRLGEPRSGHIAAGLMIAAAAISLTCAIRWVIGHPDSLGVSVPWLRIGSQTINLGVHIDSLTIVMFTMVTVVASAIFVYSIGYMHGDPRFPRFFTYLSLFCFSMLGLILSDSLLFLFIFWELVGLCSYLLIGFCFRETRGRQRGHEGVHHQPRGRLRLSHRPGHRVGDHGLWSLWKASSSQVRQGAFAGHAHC